MTDLSVMGVALSMLLTSTPAPPDAPRRDRAPSLLPSATRQRYQPPSKPPPSSVERPIVLIPGALGLGFGVAAGFVYNMAADTHARFRSGAFDTWSQAIELSDRGRAQQTLAFALGGLALTYLGFATYMALSPEPAPKALPAAPAPGGSPRGAW
jgi:hypothetical protein